MSVTRSFTQALLETNDRGIKLWYQTWGNRVSGIPVLFVHGGPGNCVADYEGINEKFFDKEKFFVVEVDQRGTGKSQVSYSRKISEQCFSGVSFPGWV